MKIGILTFHKQINYGASLQAYALLSFIKKTYENVEIVDFVPNSEIDRRTWKRKLLHLAKTILLPKEWFYNFKKRKFTAFHKKYFVLSSENVQGDKNMHNIANKYDCLISGSDQILNLTLSGNSFSFYLPFENITKISYASSFGRTNISDLEKWAILKYLPSFSHLSFRERSGYEIVNNLIGLKEENVVVDPVFLLSENEWKNIGKISKKKSHQYIFIYAMEKSEWLENTISEVTKQYPNHKIIVVKAFSSDLNINKKHKNISIAGPEEFLSLLLNASIIITNSFHGLAFSLIFRKTVYCCAHSTRNTRLANLLSMVKEDEKMISKESNAFIPINGSDALPNLSKTIEDSKSYLLNSLKELEK